AACVLERNPKLSTRRGQSARQSAAIDRYADSDTVGNPCFCLNRLRKFLRGCSVRPRKHHEDCDQQCEWFDRHQRSPSTQSFCVLYRHPKYVQSSCHVAAGQRATSVFIKTAICSASDNRLQRLVRDRRNKESDLEGLRREERR